MGVIRVSKPSIYNKLSTVSQPAQTSALPLSAQYGFKTKESSPQQPFYFNLGMCVNELFVRAALMELILGVWE